ncbi:hypothetical protein CDD82_956 [Ophiocordyceps australis]|uniref:Uncharacterized protein n=1 Tax=Ophiocordyceps australis TaxID=1399860 RepID=A0A2C5YKD6_9HYPO|nr:hypothetical protein CDD82_956 [Ophiocordyceps australis]
MAENLHPNVPPMRYEQVPDHRRELEPLSSASDKGTPESTPFKRYLIISSAEWGFEILSLLCSLGLFSTIIAIFLYMHNKPLSYWKCQVSLNSSISFLSTICSAAMMHNVSSCIGQLKWVYFKSKRQPRKLFNLERFDEASRGPYGSAAFLMRIKWNLASIGALITICRLAFSPLAQQVIDQPTRNVTTSDFDATFGYTHQYARDYTHALGLANSGLEQLLGDPLLQAAILQGITDVDIPPVFSCSGSCSWNSSYTSLGFKTVCQNVTVATLNTQKCAKHELKDKYNLTYSDPIFCNMTTPQGIHLSIQRVETDSVTIFRLNSTSDEHGVYTTLSPVLSKFAVYRASTNDTFLPYDENITECVLSAAAYSYSGAHSNGSVFEFDRVTSIDLPMGVLISSDPKGYEDQPRRKYGFRKEGLPQLELGWLDVLTLQKYFKSGTISSEWVVGNYDNPNPGISAALVGDVDLPARFDKMAARMTDYIRSGPASLLAHGGRVDS